MENPALLSIAIVTYNSADEICDCLKSITENTKKISYKLYIIDNASTDNTVSLVRENFPEAEIIETGENNGFGFGHNKMLGTECKYHAVINPDITIDSDVFSALADYLEANPEAVMVTPKILNPDSSEQKLPKRRPTAKYMLLGRLSRYIPLFKKVREEYTMADFNITEPCEIEFCTGCFMFMRSEAFKKIGGFDERFFMYLEDADLSDRISQYGKIIFNPLCHATHNWDGGSSKSFKLLKYHFESMFKYLKKKK